MKPDASSASSAVISGACRVPEAPSRHHPISARVAEALRCPVCRAPLAAQGDRWLCQDRACAHEFPSLDERPILINEANSAFRIEDFTVRRFVMGAEPGRRSLKQRIVEHLPSTGENRVAAGVLRRVRTLLKKETARPLVLVIGGSTLGAGMEVLADDDEIELVEMDVSLGDRTRIVCDAHDLPFADGTFDAVIIQAVLEHVADPPRCVAEIWRVLGLDGLAYAETPFMQQVHNGAYDFTRYTHLGHRRLFRRFHEIESGPIGGPGAALAWSIDFFVQSLTDNRRARNVLGLAARLSTFWMKYVDRTLEGTAQIYNAGWAYYFLGRRAPAAVPDREIIGMYRGAGPVTERP